MDESERTVHAGAAHGVGPVRRVCRQLVSDEVRYRFWLRRHEQPMTHVAEWKHRQKQILQLRNAAVQQVHKTALVRYLKEYHITGKARDLTLAEFHGVTDPVQAAINEHHTYLLSASTGYCAEHLLAMVDDTHGLEMIQEYRQIYDQFFALYCGQARAIRRQKQYLLAGFVPEFRATATRSREAILAGHHMPPEVFRVRLRKAS